MHKLFTVVGVLLSIVGIAVLLFSGTYTTLVVAFIGGVLTLLSPCSAVMLPAFFAYSFKHPKKLIVMTFVFWLGLASLFVPLGFTGVLLSNWLLAHLGTITIVSGFAFILFGLLTLRSKPLFSLKIKTPRLIRGKHEYTTVYLMGFLFAFTTGTCMAPIIGGIYTLTLTASYWWYPAVLLLVYSLGLVLPLFILAMWGTRAGWANHTLITGKMVTIHLGKRQTSIHSTKLIASAIFIIIGLLFIFSHGTYGLLGSYGSSGLAETYLWLNDWVISHAGVLSLLVTITLVLSGWLIYKHKL